MSFNYNILKKAIVLAIDSRLKSESLSYKKFHLCIIVRKEHFINTVIHTRARQINLKVK